MQLVIIMLIMFVILILISSLCFFIAERVYKAVQNKGGKSAATWRFVTFVLSFSFITAVFLFLNFFTYTGGR